MANLLRKKYEGLSIRPCGVRNSRDSIKFAYRLDSIIFHYSFEELDFCVAFQSPILVPHLPKRKNLRKMMRKKMMKMMILKMSSMMTQMSCVCVVNVCFCLYLSTLIFPFHSSFFQKVKLSADILPPSYHAFLSLHTRHHNNLRIPNSINIYNECIWAFVLNTDNSSIGLEPIFEVFFGNGLSITFHIYFWIALFSHPSFRL